jgi:hypothetical protein
MLLPPLYADLRLCQCKTTRIPTKALFDDDGRTFSISRGSQPPLMHELTLT